jgi:hypothetical protein
MCCCQARLPPLPSNDDLRLGIFFASHLSEYRTLLGHERGVNLQ